MNTLTEDDGIIYRGMRSGVLLAGLILSLIITAGIGRAASTAAEDTTKKLINVDYQQLRQVIESFEGKKAVLLNIWATWCGPCVEELPYIRKLQEQYPEQLQVVLLSADMSADRSRVVPFLEERGIKWTTYYKAGDNEVFLNNLSEKWSGALPFSKIWNADGQVVAEWQGAADYGKFHKQVKKAMEE